ncbi:Inositol-1,4,5-trisphosphate 5-phosphatase 1 [Vermiconidia calcicola]|uniref:Inositol-1,4,5-trisphosphate 5-phosphatase 1 n=1 Tax=Vermiconidia calcicola TaxID=1690605 RepID=A0ACC3NLN3_9PEZI|nr:Inositol-1,4,5-trisphosphate 5-phosphatase 1 [Vermiconidia calcicola]
MKVFLRESPHRAVALGTETHVLIFRHSTSSVHSKQGSTTSLQEGAVPKCIVEFSPWEGMDMKDYRSLPSLDIKGTLGLVTIGNDVFLCVVNDSKRAATVRPGETVQQIRSVEFHCLSRPDYDHLLNTQVNPFPTDDLDSDGFDQYGHKEPMLEHPCMALKKLLSGGSFYYSTDFDLTKRLQDRPADSTTVAIDSLDAGFLWNTHMIQPLVEFRSRLSDREKQALDHSGILTSAIRGFAGTVTVPASSSPARVSHSGFPSNMTLISRLSCRRAGTRFNARGIDDDGNVANFVETETIFCTDQLCFSYIQCRGSVPLFWEQQSGLPGQQKIQVTRSAEATKPAFDRHFEALSRAYGDVFIVDLLSDEKPQESQLVRLYEDQVRHSSLNEQPEKRQESEHKHLKSITYDFHAETRGNYDAARGIRRHIVDSAVAFDYFLTEDTTETIFHNGRKSSVYGQNEVLKQNGIFRTNCLDCLDRTNVVQTNLSEMMLEMFLTQQGENRPTSDFWARHGMLWADNGDTLSKIYTGTGALKSSYTRSGKSSFAGMIADVRKSAQRLYINNFEDKGRQNTIDMLLGRLMGQQPVNLYDPINDWVTTEVSRRAGEFTSSEQISIWIGTFNLNGKSTGVAEDLSPWLCPKTESQQSLPEIYGVAFQEIVDLDVQQIMSTDPHRRQIWEDAVRKTLNDNAKRCKSEDYVLLRGGQLVGASLSIFVKSSVLPFIKNVEGAVKKTGMSGMAGNKGAVAVRMEYADTSICLVTAHLAAGFANYQERNQDYRTINEGLRFQRERSIEDHKTVIWFGDFNYRIGMNNERARQLIDARDLGTLYENDQLNIQMVHGMTFPHYSETTPSFMPTYKFNLGTDEYDTSEKARIPAWTDRILTRGDNLRQLHYDSAPLRFSDHRPVWGLFKCTVSVVDQAKKDNISSELYEKRRQVVGDHTANYKGDDSDDESLNGYDSVEPGLPPASSDRRKWWLDNVMPARSTVKPPSNRHAPNPARPSNPFSPTPEPDWVKVEKPEAPPSRPSSIYSNISQASQAKSESARSDVPPRSLPPPPTPQEHAPMRPPRPVTFGGHPNNGKVHLKQTLRKPAPPPKPNKPNLLRGDSNMSAASVKSMQPPPDVRKSSYVSSNATNNLSFPPPPRIATVGSMETSRTQSPAPQPPPPRRKAAPAAETTSTPSLPPRRATAGLMDEGEAQELQNWQPLKPQ